MGRNENLALQPEAYRPPAEFRIMLKLQEIWAAFAQVVLGHRPRWSRPGGHEAAGEAAEERRMGAGGREGNADLAGGLDHASGDLEQVAA